MHIHLYIYNLVFPFSHPCTSMFLILYESYMRLLLLLCTTGLNLHIEAEFHFCNFDS